MQMDTVVITMNDTRIPMLMYEHTLRGAEKLSSTKEEKNPEDGKKSLE
jgi:hypothetical protein